MNKELSTEALAKIVATAALIVGAGIWFFVSAGSSPPRKPRRVVTPVSDVAVSTEVTPDFIDDYDPAAGYRNTEFVSKPGFGTDGFDLSD